MEGTVKPHVSFEVEKVIGVSSDGTYQVQWSPTWVSSLHLVGCEHLIREFLQRQCEKMGGEVLPLKTQPPPQQQVAADLHRQQQQPLQQQQQQQHQLLQQQQQQLQQQKENITVFSDIKIEPDAMNDHQTEKDLPENGAEDTQLSYSESPASFNSGNLEAQRHIQQHGQQQQQQQQLIIPVSMNSDNTTVVVVEDHSRTSIDIDSGDCYANDLIMSNINSEDPNLPQQLVFNDFELEKINRTCCSVKNFAKTLFMKMTTAEERYNKNCSGRLNKESHCPIKLQRVRDYVFKVHKVPEGTMKAVWSGCITAINQHVKRETEDMKRKMADADDELSGNVKCVKL